jgi:hypothetical protein
MQWTLTVSLVSLSLRVATNGRIVAASIDRNSCVRLIGQLVLEASVLPTGTCKISLLIDMWQRHLPAAWSTDARLELIEVCQAPQ